MNTYRSENILLSDTSGYIKIVLLLIVYTVGLTGFWGFLPLENFERLTPYNLLFATLLLLSHHTEWNVRNVMFFLIVFLLGFFIEVAGVHSRLIFGSYSYGKTLGIQLFDVPLIIGINWLLLVYAASAVAAQFSLSVVCKIIVASALMVVLDFFIEPFAIAYDLWVWNGKEIPLQNYIGWTICALIMQTLLFAFRIDTKNIVAVWLYFIQLFFFLLLYCIQF
jgi:putative membrane protein